MKDPWSALTLATRVGTHVATISVVRAWKVPSPILKPKHHEGELVQPEMMSAIQTMIMLANLLMATDCDKFTANDCRYPYDISYIRHEDCRVETENSQEAEMYILQRTEMREIVGYECKVKRTIIVNYCGAYSRTKETGESIYKEPIMVPSETCREMAKTGSYVAEQKSYPVRMNAISMFSFFTHGSITRTDSNIHCNGESLRLSNGKITHNMLRRMQYTVTLRETNLTISGSKVILQSTQTLLGEFGEGYGQYDTTTVVWNSRMEAECNLMKVARLRMKSVQTNVWYNDDRKIEITTGETFLNTKCDIMVTKTNLGGVYVASPGQIINGIRSIDTQNLNPNTHYESQLLYLADKVTGDIKDRYLDSTHYSCNEIYRTPLASTRRIKNNMYARNLGDATLIFACKEMEVAPVDSPVCHSKLPVRTITGEMLYLDPVTRLLTNDTIVLPCSIPFLPAYQTTSGKILMYTPSKQTIEPRVSKHMNAENITALKMGIYDPSMMQEFFKLSYIQSWSKHSFSVVASQFCTNCDKTSTLNPSQYAAQFRKLRDLEDPTEWFGINITHIGSYCSIIVVAAMILVIVQKVVVTTIKCCVLHEGISTVATLSRACCTELYLIGKDRGTPKTKDIELV